MRWHGKGPSEPSRMEQTLEELEQLEQLESRKVGKVRKMNTFGVLKQRDGLTKNDAEHSCRTVVEGFANSASKQMRHQPQLQNTTMRTHDARTTSQAKSCRGWST